jgi:hypothetical protein
MGQNRRWFHVPVIFRNEMKWIEQFDWRSEAFWMPIPTGQILDMWYDSDAKILWMTIHSRRLWVTTCPKRHLCNKRSGEKLAPFYSPIALRTICLNCLSILSVSGLPSLGWSKCEFWRRDGLANQLTRLRLRLTESWWVRFWNSRRDWNRNDHWFA